MMQCIVVRACNRVHRTKGTRCNAACDCPLSLAFFSQITRLIEAGGSIRLSGPLSRRSGRALRSTSFLRADQAYLPTKNWSKCKACRPSLVRRAGRAYMPGVPSASRREHISKARSLRATCTELTPNQCPRGPRRCRSWGCTKSRSREA